MANKYYRSPYVSLIEHKEPSSHPGGGGGLGAQTGGAVVSKANFDIAADSINMQVSFTPDVDALSSSADLSFNETNDRIVIVTAGTYVTQVSSVWQVFSAHSGKRDTRIVGNAVGSNFGSYPYIAGAGRTFYSDAWADGEGSFLDNYSITGYLPAGADLRLLVTNADPTEIQRIQQLVWHVYRIA